MSKTLSIQIFAFKSQKQINIIIGAERTTSISSIFSDGSVLKNGKFYAFRSLNPIISNHGRFMARKIFFSTQKIPIAQKYPNKNTANYG